MNGEVSDEFVSRCGIVESFDQFIASFSDYRVLTSSTAINFTQAPGTDVCSSSYTAVLHVIGLLRNK